MNLSFVWVVGGAGVSATAVMSTTELHLDWTNVFNVHRDVTFSVFAGTSEGYGDIINHVTTKATSLSVHCSRTLMFLSVSRLRTGTALLQCTVQCSRFDRNGRWHGLNFSFSWCCSICPLYVFLPNSTFILTLCVYNAYESASDQF